MKLGGENHSLKTDLRRRRALKSVQLAKRGFGKSRGYAVINVSQFLPKINRYKNLGKD